MEAGGEDKKRQEVGGGVIAAEQYADIHIYPHRGRKGNEKTISTNRTE